MLDKLIPVKSFLGKYHQELLSLSKQDKYKNTDLGRFFEQRFHIQNNKVRMIVDPLITDLTLVISGNEIYISKKLYDHPNVIVNNSLESSQQVDIKELYDSEIFSTIAYLLCQNQTTLQIVGEIDEPIYITYKADYETFYNSLLVFDILDGIEVEVIEEIESFGALNAVTNYILSPESTLNLRSFYKNHISSLSFFYRNIIVRDGAAFNHILFGKGSTTVIDENRIQISPKAIVELFGIVNSLGKNFHTILGVQSETNNYSVSVDYKGILFKNSNVSFYPTILGELPTEDSATIDISNITTDDIPSDEVSSKISEFISGIVNDAILVRMSGVKRFYDNKSKYLFSL